MAGAKRRAKWVVALEAGITYSGIVLGVVVGLVTHSLLAGAIAAGLFGIALLVLVVMGVSVAGGVEAFRELRAIARNRRKGAR